MSSIETRGTRVLGLMLAAALGLSGTACTNGGGGGGGGDDDDDDHTARQPRPSREPDQSAGDRTRSDADAAVEDDELCPAEALGYGTCCDGATGDCSGDGDVLAWCCEEGLLCWIACSGACGTDLEGTLACFDGGEGEGECECDFSLECDPDAESYDCECDADCWDGGEGEGECECDFSLDCDPDDEGYDCACDADCSDGGEGEGECDCDLYVGECEYDDDGSVCDCDLDC